MQSTPDILYFAIFAPQWRPLRLKISSLNKLPGNDAEKFNYKQFIRRFIENLLNIFLNLYKFFNHARTHF